MRTTSTGTAQRYTQIVNAATQLMTEGGLAAVTIDRIRQRANSSLTKIYGLFETRERILEAAFKDIHQKFYATAEYKLHFACTAEEQLAAIIDGIFAEELFTEANLHGWVASINFHLYHGGNFSYAPDAHRRVREKTHQLFLELGNGNPEISSQFWTFVDGIWLAAALKKGSLSREKCIGWTFEYVESLVGRKLNGRTAAFS